MLSIFILGNKINGVSKVPEVGTTHLGAPSKARAPWFLVPSSVAFLVVSYFPKKINIPKLT